METTPFHADKQNSITESSIYNKQSKKSYQKRLHGLAHACNTGYTINGDRACATLSIYMQADLYCKFVYRSTADLLSGGSLSMVYTVHLLKCMVIMLA